ncbi:plasmid replication DNA-binding protein [Acinetobacter radioresistens]|uniref:plasmid replication DNA-binding protein n=1 Tax=Acinetobacter radioresistens TaxID=40216 RepID=UPI002245CD64|nr:plasmid replication DNA-binding protein [Acinetobacter radioresistens]MCX0335094.1 plasmid replication DNA-binding protein [Acinetobacter radioresistens]
MKAMTVIELAKLYGMNRQSIYKRINKGDLSKNSDGQIDLSEAIRVFGEPAQRSNSNVTQLQSSEVHKSAEVDMLKQQVDMLQKQLELAQEREAFQRQQLQAKDDQISSLQLLLGGPKQQSEVEPIKESIREPVIEKEHPEVLKAEIDIQQRIKRRSLFGRVVDAILE